MKSKRLSLVFTLATATALSLCGVASAAAQMSEPPLQSQAGPPTEAATAPLAPEQMQQLVAPIALYPDTLVAQILAAASYPTQIVEAERFLEQNQGLTGEALANAVNEQNWAPSVKALTAFPQVLSDMNQNLAWTAELGDANYSQPEDLMSAIQSLRQQAQQAGTLQTNAQVTVQDVNGSIEIEPTNPDQMYVPDYDPAYAYGQPVALWPGFYPWWTAGGAYISFGIGVPMRPWYGYGWGCRHWRLGWGSHPGVWFDRDRWHHRPHEVYDRRQYEHGGRFGYQRGNGYVTPRPGMPSGFPGDYHVGRGSGAPNGYGNPHPGMHSGAVGGVIVGGQEGRGTRGGYQGGFHGGSHAGGESHGGGHYGGGSQVGGYGGGAGHGGRR